MMFLLMRQGWREGLILYGSLGRSKSALIFFAKGLDYWTPKLTSGEHVLTFVNMDGEIIKRVVVEVE